MSMKNAKPPTLLHTDCLQRDIALVPQGPGAFAVALRRDIRIESPFDVETICLPTGTPLVGTPQVDSFADAVHQHLHGDTDQSDLRLGVALLLGHHPTFTMEHPLGSAVRADIDAWLGAYTAFVFWPRTGSTFEACNEGFFAGIARSWRLQHIQ